MCVRTSDRGEPAKISFCSLRTDLMENTSDSTSAGPPCDGTSAGDCIDLSMNGPSLAQLDSAARLLAPRKMERGRRRREGWGLFCLFCTRSELRLLQADFISLLQAGSVTTLSWDRRNRQGLEKRGKAGCRSFSLVFERTAVK